MKRIFDIRTILTSTTSRLVTKSESKNDNGIGALYEFLEYMTGESPYTHSLGRFAEECNPYILQKYPEIEKASSECSLETLDNFISTEDDVQIAIDKWINYLCFFYDLRIKYPIMKIEDHKSITPILELQNMMDK